MAELVEAVDQQLIGIFHTVRVRIPLPALSIHPQMDLLPIARTQKLSTIRAELLIMRIGR
jgi:hypothetical protein